MYVSADAKTASVLSFVFLLLLLFVAGSCQQQRSPGRDADTPEVSDNESATPEEEGIAPEDADIPEADDETLPDEDNDALCRLRIVNTVGGDMGELAIAEGKLYAAAGIAGVQIWDLADPADPLQLGSVASGWLTTHLAVRDQLIYTTSWSWDAHDSIPSGAIFHVIDEGNSAQPAITGSHQRKDFIGGLLLNGPYAYLTGDGYGLTVMDISDPSAPSPIVELSGIGESRALAMKDSLLITMHPNTYPDGNMRTFDISDPADPKLLYWGQIYNSTALEFAGDHALVTVIPDGLKVATIFESGAVQENFSLGLPGYQRDIVVNGSYAYIASEYRGIHIVDVADPLKPELVGWLDLPEWDEEASAGVWGLAYYEGYIYAASATDGIFVVDVADPYNPFLVRHIGGPESTIDLAMKGDRLFTVGDERGITVLDIGDRRTPRMIGLTEGLYLDANNIVVAGDRVVVNVPGYGTPGRLYLFHLEEGEEAPRLESSVATGERLFHLQVAGDLAVTASEKQVEVYDLTGPRLLRSFPLPEEAEMFYPRFALDKNAAYTYSSVKGLIAFPLDRPDTIISTRPVTLTGVRDLVAAEGLLYVAHDGGVTVFDVSALPVIKQLSAFPTQQPAYKAVPRGELLFVQGRDNVEVLIERGVGKYNLLTRIDVPFYLYDLEVAGDHIYLANPNGGMLVMALECDGIAAAEPVDEEPGDYDFAGYPDEESPDADQGPDLPCAGRSLNILADLSSNYDTITDAHRAGDRLYLTIGYYDDAEARRIVSYDVHDPEDPTLLSQFTSHERPVALAGSGDRLFIGTRSGTVEMFDNADTVAPALAGLLTVDAPVSLLEVRDDLLFVGTAMPELFIYRLAPPLPPQVLARLTLPGVPNDIELHADLLYLTLRGYGEGLFTGLAIYDLVDPAAPTLLELMGVPLASEVAWANGMLYLLSSASLHIVDVADPQEPRLQKTLLIAEDPHSMDVVGDRLTLLAGGAVRTYDIADPTAPLLLGSSGTVRGEELRLFDTTAVTFAGTYTYTYFSLVDLGDPAAPVVRSSPSVPDLDPAPGHSAAFAFDAGRLYSSHYLNEEVTIFDVSAAGWPLHLGELETTTDHQYRKVLAVAAEGDDLYALLPDRIECWDITIPTAPVYLKATTVAVDLGARLALDEEYLYLVWQNTLSIFSRDGGGFLSSLTGIGETVSLVSRPPYLYLADGDYDLTVVSAADPLHPQIVATIPTDRPVTQTLRNGDELLLLGGDALDILDISAPLTPVAKGHLALPTGVLSISLSGDLLYALDDTGRVLRITIADPTHPAITGLCPATHSEPIAMVADGDIVFLGGTGAILETLVFTCDGN